MHTHACTHTHTRIHTHTHTHTHTRTHAPTHTLEHTHLNTLAHTHTARAALAGPSKSVHAQVSAPPEAEGHITVTLSCAPASTEVGVFAALSACTGARVHRGMHRRSMRRGSQQRSPCPAAPHCQCAPGPSVPISISPDFRLLSHPANNVLVHLAPAAAARMPHRLHACARG